MSPLEPGVGSHLLSPLLSRQGSPLLQPDTEISFVYSVCQGSSEGAMLRARERWRRGGNCVRVCKSVPSVLGGARGRKGQLFSGIGLASPNPAGPHKGGPSPGGLGRVSQAFAFSPPSAPAHKGLAPCARSSALPAAFHPRRAVPAAPCWPPRGRAPGSLLLGAGGQLLASPSHLWLSSSFPTPRSSSPGRAPPRPPEDKLHCAAAAIRKGQGSDPANGAPASGRKGSPPPQGVGTGASP